MKINTSELTGPALDWAVACAERKLITLVAGVFVRENDGMLSPSKSNPLVQYQPSTNWSQGGPIIEREGIEIVKGNPLYFPRGNENGDFYEPLWIAGKQHGRSPLIAAMRCLVASKLGNEVEIPGNLA